MFPDVLEHKVMRHFEEGDDVRSQLNSESSVYLLYIGGQTNKIKHLSLADFSNGNWGVLHEERSFSWIWKAFCLLFQDFA